MFIKKKNIFRKFIIPLALILFAQAVVAYGTLWLGGTTGYLEEYSAGIMEQIVKNRNLILENSMIHRWTDISNECHTVNSYLEQISEEKNIREDDFLNNSEAKQELLDEMLLPSINMLRRTGVNGVYIILADGLSEMEQDQNGESVYKCSGIYFRDSDAYVNPKDYSDLLMIRGAYEFSHKLNIPFDSVWTTKFNLKEQQKKDADNFFFKPYTAALENPYASPLDLGYWGKVFSLEGESESDGYRMVSYSMPLMTESGYVYGVMGIELSVSALDNLLPEKELNGGAQSGYVLAEYQDDGSLVPFYSKGAAIKRNVALEAPMQLESTNYRALYRLKGVSENKHNFYANIVPFSMYNLHTPFANNGWALVGIQNENALFGIGDRIMGNVLLVIAGALLLGFLCIYILMNRLIKPITDLAEWIRTDKRSPVKDYKETNILEIDDLYEAIYDMTDKQKIAEATAFEEKERYLIALQSSTDIIFTYNIEEDSMELLDLMTGDKNGKKTLITNLVKSIRENKHVYDVDRRMIERIFVRQDEGFKIHFRYHLNAKGFMWMELSGKAIHDASGKKVKIIGSIRNVHEQKMKEQMENKATRIDMVTGLYREEIGQRIISAEVEIGREGYLVLMDLDKFKEMNEQYGIDFGDAVLEEIGSYILKLKHSLEKSGKRIVAVRVGGDEILLWMRGFEHNELNAFFERFYGFMKQLCENGKFECSVTIVALWLSGKSENYSQLTDLVCASMYYCKRRRPGCLTMDQEIPVLELRSEHSEKRSFNEIASLGSTKKLNLVTKAFTLFERGNQVTPVISVLFAKLGEAYKASDIILTEIRRDFNTSNVFSQWHVREGAERDTQIFHFGEEELYTCVKKLENGAVLFGEEDGLTERERWILHIPIGLSGYCVPMYDNRTLTRVISFLRYPEQRSWSDEVLGEIQEIVRIIETNISRERYDLASRAKSDFLSRMSHEIRTPMNAIIGMTTIARSSREKPDEIDNCLQKIDRSSHYLLGLINDILDMSKIESGKMRLSLADDDMLTFLQEISDLMGDQFREKQIVYTQYCDMSNTWVQADFMRLKQIIINLLGNALKFTPSGGTVTFVVEERDWKNAVYGAEEGETGIYFEVTDTGIGITEENQKRIFDSFEQAENSTAVSYGGTGLGLSISSRLVHMMGGEIHLESEEGKGSRFSFFIKLKKAADQNAAIQTELLCEEQDFTGKVVLMIEDNELNTEIATTLLEMCGFRVETADNGLRGLEAFKCSVPDYYDLILMDIRMPVMDGLEATKAIRRLDRPDAQTVPIIAMTANAFDEDMKKSIDSGMDGHLAKPVDVKELLKVAGQAIANCRKKS